MPAIRPGVEKIYERLRTEDKTTKTSAEGRVMERSSKRGKIPQQDWPSIIKRYEAGETLASIARTYDCSAPAISYIVSRSRAREGTVENTAEPSELRLVKGHTNEAPEDRIEAGTSDPTPPLHSDPTPRLHEEPQPIEPGRASIEPARVPDVRKEPASRDVDGLTERQGQGSPDTSHVRSEKSEVFNSASVPQNGEHRRTLRLSPSPESTPRSDAQDRDMPGHNSAGFAERLAVRPPGDHQPEFIQPGRPVAAQFAPTPIGAPIRATAEQQGRKDGGAFIDQALRERVDGDITAFLAAFDAALAHDTLESRAGLREATDRLLRAGARTRIELERLEARVPLPPRDNSGQMAPAWRPR
jgi:hypothetical protein